MPFLQKLRRDYLALPAEVRTACAGVLIFTTGWGLGADAFFSVYINSIVSDFFWVGAFAALVSFIRLLFNIPVGHIDGRADERMVLIVGKCLYILSGISYFCAGYFQSPLFLMGGLILNGIGNPMIFTTYLSYIRQHTDNSNATLAFGLYNTSLSIALGGGAIITAFVLVPYITELHWFYLFISLFAIISMRGDFSLPEKHTQPLRHAIREMISANPYGTMFRRIRTNHSSLNLVFFIQFFWGMLEMTGFLFFPLLLFEETRNLGLIALIFGVARLPYFFSFFFAEASRNREKIQIISSSFLMISLFLLLLAHVHSAWIMLTVAATISLCLSAIRPLADGLISQLAPVKQKSEITGTCEFMVQAGGITGSLLFGTLAHNLGLRQTFILLAVLVGLLSISIFLMRNTQRTISVLAWLRGGFGIAELLRKPQPPNPADVSEQKM